MPAHAPSPVPTPEAFAATPDPSTGFAKLPTPSLPRPRRDAVAKPMPQRVTMVVTWLVLLAAMGSAVFGTVLYFTGHYRNHVRATMKKWWGVTVEPFAGEQVPGHEEYIDATYIGLVVGVPSFIAGLLFLSTRQHVGTPTGVFATLSTWFRRKSPCWLKLRVDITFGEAVYLLTILVGNLVVFLGQWPARMDKLKTMHMEHKTSAIIKEVGYCFGYNSIFCLVYLFLPSTKNCFWMDMLNISYAHGIKYHRWLGVATVVFALLHGGCYFIAFAKDGVFWDQIVPCFDCSLGEYRGYMVWFNVFGEIALLSFLCIGLTAIPFVRRRCYELFYYVHHLFIVAIVFVQIHYKNTIWWLYPAICLYMINRIAASVHSNVPTELVELKALPEGVTKLVFRRSTSAGSGFNAGAFLYMRIPALSKLQWHAFSVASSPLTSRDTFTVYAKTLGNWTQQLHALAQQHQTATAAGDNPAFPLVYIDAFYGNRLPIYHNYPKLFLMGGGIGVTPLVSILEDIYARCAAGVLLDTVETQQVWFVWACRDKSLIKEFAPLFARIRAFDPHEHTFKLRLFFTKSEDKDDEYEEMLGQSTTPKLPTNEKNLFHAEPRPFERSLRSPLTQAAMFIVVFGASALLVFWGRYDNRIQNMVPNLWPWQRFGETLLMLLGAVLGYIVVFSEKIMAKRAGVNASSTPMVLATPDPSINTTNMEDGCGAAANFMEEFQVVAGMRPVLIELLDTALGADRQSTTPTHPIGVISSGPKGMVRAVEVSALRIGGHFFDLHHEEFAL